MLRRRLSLRFRRSISAAFWRPLASGEAPVLDAVLLETGDGLLTEDNSRLLMEG
jgi:hypothetical protein